VSPSGSKTIPSFLLTGDNIDDPDSEKYIYRASC
jgi:hypothetical protein